VTLAAFLLLVVLIASNLVAIRYSNRELDPFWNGGARFTIAALIFVAMMIATRERLPSGKGMVGALLYGTLAIAAYFVLIYWGMVEVRVGYGQTLLALVPLLTVLLAVTQRLERLSGASVSGAALALGGVALVFTDQLGADVPLLRAMAIVVAAACAAQAGIVMKLLPPVRLIPTNAVAMSLGAITLLAVSFATGEARVLPEGGATWFAFAYLATVGTVGTFLLALYVLRYWTASAASYQFVLAPLVSVALAALLLGEGISWLFVGGAALVISGVYVGALRPQQAAEAERAVAA
jgi:drug/metabolite transporter (DMT)-like permease